MFEGLVNLLGRFDLGRGKGRHDHVGKRIILLPMPIIIAKVTTAVGEPTSLYFVRTVANEFRNLPQVGCGKLKRDF
jgi:hypothetical protein